MRPLTALSIRNSSPLRVWLAGWLLLAAPAAAAADDQTPQDSSRRGQLEAERERKADELSTPERSTVERALYWYDNQYVLARVFGGWHGFHLAGGDFPAGAGTKVGVGFTYAIGPAGLAADAARPNRLSVDALAAYSTRGYERTGAAFNMRNVGGAAVDLTLSGEHYTFPQEDFFGLGRDSTTANRTDYKLEGTEAGAAVKWTAAKLVDLSGGVFYVSPTIGSGTDDRFPSTERLFDPATLPAFAQQSDFIRSDVAAAFDWRDNPRHPHAGGRYGVQLSNFHDQDLNAYGFRRVEVDVQQYVPLPSRYRIIALRAAAVLTDPYAGQDVPFFYQPTLGGSQALRGFREFRFRDRNSLVLTAEYRWEAWWALDGALFVDAGKVAADRRDLTLDRLDVSYGVGFRVHSNSAFVTRLDLAFSREGFIPLLRFEHVF